MELTQAKVSNKQALALFKGILKPRMIEEKMLVLLRQGKISKWFSGIGQEAISAGVTMAMDEEEYILPMHRNLGVFTSRNIPLDRLFSQFQGKMAGFTNGRDRSFHFGTKEHHIIGMISHLGPQLGIADGIALSDKLDGNGKTTVVFSGDGGASEGDFHEALNVAAVWDLPVIFVIENNGYGLSTPSNEQFRCKQFIDKGIGYGMEAVQVDGNNVLEVYSAVKDIRTQIKEKSRPFILECMTFRMRGHEEASGTKYVPKELMEEWQQKDPVLNLLNHLISLNVITDDSYAKMREEIKLEIEDGLNSAYENPVVSDANNEVADVYAPSSNSSTPQSDKTTELRLIDAVKDGLEQAMIKHPGLVLMGQDIADYGGVFKATEGFVEQFGKERVRNTPLCESAIVGAGLGLSIKGQKAMVEMQFADFVTCGFNQIINNLAKSYYRWGQNADVVVRMPTGAGVGAGPFHSQSNEAWFYHTPGLKIAYPAFPADAKGLLLTAFEDPNPVMFFEQKSLYRSIRGEVPEGYYTIPFGEANILSEGSDISVITYGVGVHWALEALEQFDSGCIEVIDLRTLAPLDTETVFKSVRKTGKAIILHEDTITGSIASDLSALITENCFEKLDAPVIRSASLDTPVPFAAALEKAFLPKDRFVQQLKDLINY
ncbi:MAG: 2-oxoisovalerate dehydrogenase E1 component [Bacteroidia bacterium]|jgi:2-oxoisovalerate dehydrogenase E1 component